MKKLFCILLCICLLTGCATGTENPYLKNIRDQIQFAEKPFGVAYIGTAEGDFAQVLSYVENQVYNKIYPFITEIKENHFVQNDGNELYCIIPADKSVTISIYQAEFSEEASGLSKTEKLWSRSDGKPILIRGNISDTMPNLMIVAKKGDTVCEYTPCLSLKNGMLENSEKLVYDFSPYELMDNYNGMNPEVMWDFFGDWVCTVTEPKIGAIDMKLSLSADGIWYSFQSETMTGSYTGNWLVLSDQRLRMELGGETQNSNMAGVTGLHTDVDSIYYWDVRDGNLFLTYINGTPLYPSAVVTEYQFVPAA